MAHTKRKSITFKGKEPLLRQFQLNLPTELEGATSVLQWLETTIKPLIPQKAYWQCQVALVEAFTNIVRHAHQNLPETTPIDIKINLYHHYIEMLIWDWGEPFDLAKYIQSHKDTYQSIEKEEGRGLYLINQLSDELEYNRVASEERNCLIMRKLIP